MNSILINILVVLGIITIFIGVIANILLLVYIFKDF